MYFYPDYSKSNIVIRARELFHYYRRISLHYLVACLFFSALMGNAAAQDLRGFGPDQRARLLSLSDSLAIDFLEANALAREKAGQMGLEIRFTTAEGVRYELQRIENGLPFYYRTMNAGAAITSGANQLHPGGSRRLFLTGKGLTAGMWDAGSLFDHLEFQGRYVNRNPATQIDAHATHVAGTMIATGINENARGMAYEGRLRVYDWNSDISEMAGEAAAGMLISNHSYGTPLGWEFRDGSWRWMGAASADEDYRFGFYSNVSRSIDQVAYTAPYFLSVWAAGNDRNDAGDGSRPPDGPYDTIGPEGTAKNVITVGAVNGIPGGYTRTSDVVMTEFSSWGPTDDGRIKPDLVAKGRAVFSTNLNDSYRSTSGTSMATPVVAGSLMLIQHLYHELSGGEYLRAASLKGLAIHTANPAGNGPAPDYSFGWGLLDVGKMAGFLTHLESERLKFIESTILDGEQLVYEFAYDGGGPIMATLSWTDVPGTPVSPQLNPTDLMLVNDLDMRIVAEDGKVYFPWVLDPAQPVANATTGDNFRDNVEKIRIANPPEGNYRIMISHKGSLDTGRQDFSLFLQSGDVPARTNLYWIGGQGNWSDPSKWSLTSGGAPADMVPGPDDHVVLDQNSFGEQGQVLTLDQEGFCHTFTVKSDAIGLFDFARHRLNISVSVFIERDFTMPETSGRMILNGRFQNGYVLLENAGSENMSDVQLLFDNPEGKWRIVSDLVVDRLVIRQGEVLMEDRNISVRELQVMTNESFKRLHMGASVLSGLQTVRFPRSDFEVSAGSASLVFGHEEGEPDGEAVLRVGGTYFHSLVNHADLQVFDSFSVKNFTNHGLVGIHEIFTAENVAFTETAVFSVGEDGNLLISESFTGSGIPGSLVLLEGLGMNSSITGLENRRFCLDYVRVRNLPASGPAIFNAGPNSLVENSEGWLNVDCDEVLYADFSVTSPCRYSWTFFHDESSGIIEEWEWQFGNLGKSDLPDPIFTFQNTGNQSIRLTVSDGTYTQTRAKQIQIINNPLPDPQVYSSGTSYFVDVYNVNYQWYRNGQPIDGANSQYYQNENARPGVYQVLISNNNCNRPSKNQITVSTGEPELAGEGLLVFPNPSGGRLRIRAGRPIERIELVDLTGRTLIILAPQQEELELDVSMLRPGIYLLRALVGGRHVQKKIQVI